MFASLTRRAGPQRRIMKAGVIQCNVLGVNGNTDIDLRDMQIIELFLTEPSANTAGDKAIYGEVVRHLTSSNSEDISVNVRLLD